jgi:hypothetical protein
LQHLFRKRTLSFCGLAVLVGVLSNPTGRVSRLWGQDPAARDATAWDARELAILFLEHYPELTDPHSRQALRQAVATYDLGWATISRAYNLRSTASAEAVQQGLDQGDQLFRQSTDQFAAVFIGFPAVSLTSAATAVADVSIPFGSTALLLKRQLNGKPVRFLHKRIDLSFPPAGEPIDTATSGDFYCLLELANPASSSSRIELALQNGSRSLGKLTLAVSIPAKHPLQVEIIDVGGQPVDAAAGLYTSANRFLVPASALDFTDRGFFYQPVRYRDCAQARYWPGGQDSSLCFFVHGGFTMAVPEGTYHVLAAKGPEYLPVDQTITVGPT